jgi:hypothetical protein
MAPNETREMRKNMTITKWSLLAAALLSAGVSAQTLTPQDGHAVPGQTATVAFVVDLGAVTTAISSLSLELSFDTAALQLDPVSGNQNLLGSTTSLDAGFSAVGTYFQSSDEAGLHALWFAVDSNGDLMLPFPAINPGGSLSFGFTIRGTPASGSSLPVILSLDFSDQNADALPQLLATARVVVDPAPVPEPATWALGLAGLLAIAARKRSNNGPLRRA